MVSTTLRTFDINGSDLSGSNGTANRTYTLPYASVSGAGIKIWVNGAMLHQGDDFSLSANVITFLNAIFNAQVINGEYFSFTSDSVATVYGNTSQLACFMGVDKTIPNVDTTTRENVGTGDNTLTRFWLDNMGVLAGTYTLSYGASEASLTELTEDTHYTIDLSTSLITLTAGGVTALDTNILYAEYTYNILNLKDSLLADALSRAEDEIDNFTNNHFVDGTATTPSWNQHLNEVQDGKGFFDRNYFTLQKYPVPDVSTTLNGAVAADDTTITVVSTQGFPSSGSILVNGDKILYTGKTSTTFTGCTSVSAHDDGLAVKAYVIEISTTSPGGSITWDVLSEGTEFEFDRSTGRVHLYASGGYVFGQYLDDTEVPPKGVANRVRVSYLSGVDSIPERVTKATLILASRDLMSLAVRKAHSSGLNSFNPNLLNVDQDEYEKLLMNLRNEQFKAV